MNILNQFKMKTNTNQFLLILILGFFLFPGNLKSQEHKFEKVRIGISLIPLASNSVGPFESVVGGGSLTSSKFFSGMLSLDYPINQRFFISSAVGYSRQQIIAEGAPNPPNKPSKDTLSLKIFEVPVLAGFHFGRFFYANLGPMIHFDLSKKQEFMDKQNGLGLQLGIGVDWDLSSSFSLQLEPGLKAYSLIPFESGNYPDRIMSLGIKIGAKYVLW